MRPATEFPWRGFSCLVGAEIGRRGIAADIKKRRCQGGGEAPPFICHDPLREEERADRWSHGIPREEERRGRNLVGARGSEWVLR